MKMLVDELDGFAATPDIRDVAFPHKIGFLRSVAAAPDLGSFQRLCVLAKDGEDPACPEAEGAEAEGPEAEGVEAEGVEAEGAEAEGPEAAASVRNKLSSCGFREVACIRCRARPGHSYLMFTNEDDPATSAPDEVWFVIQGMDSPNIDLSCRLCFCYGTPVDASWLQPELAAEVRSIAVNRIHNNQNVYLQVAGLAKGIERTPAEHCRFVVKLRSDEHYTRFEAIIDKLRERPDVVVTNNIFFRKTHVYPYHPSDHLIAGSRENMQLMATTALTVLRQRSFDRCLRVAEQIICGSYIKAKLGLRILPANGAAVRELMLRLYDCVPVESLGDYLVMANSMQRVLVAGGEAAAAGDGVPMLINIRSMADI